MPAAPLPANVERFLDAPRASVVATLRDDGSPVTAAVWYRWADGLLHMSMGAASQRARHLRRDPRLSLTVLGDSWYTHVSLLGRAVSIAEDTDYSALDALAQWYTGAPYTDHESPSLTVTAEVERWHTFGEI